MRSGVALAAFISADGWLGWLLVLAALSGRAIQFAVICGLFFARRNKYKIYRRLAHIV